MHETSRQRAAGAARCSAAGWLDSMLALFIHLALLFERG
jgi:hypothetical protein